MDNPIDLKSYRRYGVEVELNTTTGIIKRWDIDACETPDGSEEVAYLVSKATRERAYIQGWHHTHNNNHWIIKSDRSCGIEVCSPILKGWLGLKKIVRVIDFFNKSQMSADDKCSLHVHVNIGDLDKTQLATVIAYWIKCEHIFMDAMPDSRKMNRYCQFIGMSDLFSHEFRMNPNDLINRVSSVKYYTLNAYHLQKGGGLGSHNTRRPTIEFRIAENNVCIDPWEAKNWIRLCLHFVECTKDLGLPEDYRRDDPSTGLLWLDAPDLFRILRFDEELSPGLCQVRSWFLERLNRYGYNTSLPGIWSNAGRKVARSCLVEMNKRYSDPSDSETLEEKLYSKKYAL